MNDCHAFPLHESESCSDDGIADACEYSAWSAWSACTLSCGQGEKFRSRSALAGPAAVWYYPTTTMMPTTTIANMSNSTAIGPFNMTNMTNFTDFGNMTNTSWVWGNVTNSSNSQNVSQHVEPFLDFSLLDAICNSTFDRVECKIEECEVYCCFCACIKTLLMTLIGGCLYRFSVSTGLFLHRHSPASSQF